MTLAPRSCPSRPGFAIRMRSRSLIGHRHRSLKSAPRNGLYTSLHELQRCDSSVDDRGLTTASAKPFFVPTGRIQPLEEPPPRMGIEGTGGQPSQPKASPTIVARAAAGPDRTAPVTTRPTQSRQSGRRFLPSGPLPQQSLPPGVPATPCPAATRWILCRCQGRLRPDRRCGIPPQLLHRPRPQ